MSIADASKIEVAPRRPQSGRAGAVRRHELSTVYPDPIWFLTRA